MVWTPDTLHVEEILIDASFFEANMTAANILIERAVLPEIIGAGSQNQEEKLNL